MTADVSRPRVAAAQVGGVQVAMHLDLGGPVSELREALWTKVKAQPATSSSGWSTRSRRIYQVF